MSKKPQPKSNAELADDYSRWFKLIVGPPKALETPRETQERLARERKQKND